MRSNIVALIAGVVFAVGLVVSGMTNPQKVIGFLDVAGSWDLSLAFVMGGAVLLNLVTFKWVLKQPKPVVGVKFHVPTNRVIDKRLVLGSAIFGLGWGLGGFCPGPGLVSLVSGEMSAIVFVATMLVSMVVYDKVRAARQA